MHVKIKRLGLRQLPNARDLGGIPAEGGKHVIKGRLFRSGKLYNLSDETRKFFEDAGVKTVIDLRIYTELAEFPDTKIGGSEYVHLPVLCTATPQMSRDATMRETETREAARIKKEYGRVDNYMLEMYKYILFGEEAKGYIKQAVRLIIEADAPVLWHCSGGKDRAGLVAMLVESMLGVDESVIIKDYTSSTRFNRRKFFWQKAGLIIAPISVVFKLLLGALMNAKKKYITGALDEIKRRYGSVIGYCKTELGVTDEDIGKLKSKYLV